MPVLLLLDGRCVGGRLEAAKVHDPPWGEQVPRAPSSHSALLEAAAMPEQSVHCTETHSGDAASQNEKTAVLCKIKRQAHG